MVPRWRILGDLSVCQSSEPGKNDSADRDAVWVEDSSGPKDPCIRWGPDLPWEWAILGDGAAHCTVQTGIQILP